MFLWSESWKLIGMLSHADTISWSGILGLWSIERSQKRELRSVLVIIVMIIKDGKDIISDGLSWVGIGFRIYWGVT